VKVYSNCERAELFVNGKSVGVKQRNSRDFPAAGLRWMTPFVRGKNNLRVVAIQGSTRIEDEIEFLYQTEKWAAPAELKLSEISRNTVGGKETVTVEARLYDTNGILCLDARNQVHFTLAGTGKLIDNRGTSRGSRVVEMYNGRAEISLKVNRDGAVVAAHTAGLKAAFLSLS